MTLKHGLMIVGITFFLSITLLKLFHIQFNFTSSMPIGFYRRLNTPSIHRGDIVAACLPKAISQTGLKHHYLATGKCPAHVIPVLKTVIAIPHDTIQITPQGMMVNHHFYQAPIQTVDHQHRPVKRWTPTGTYTNTNFYWLYGSHSPQYSWDSRYFGGVTRNSILGVYRLLF